MKLIVGLGNPGKEYEETRHNIGFCAIDRLSSFFQIPTKMSKMQGLYGIGSYNGEKLLLLKPQKYMNLSGEVVTAFMRYFKITSDDVLIISDALDLEVGKYKLKAKGSSGGHNGLKNIELHIGTNIYKRLKIGISNDKKADTKDYVLGKFSKEEHTKIEQILENVPAICESYLTKPFDTVMNLYNKK